jgi:hypothetical protein
MPTAGLTSTSGFATSGTSALTVTGSAGLGAVRGINLFGGFGALDGLATAAGDFALVIFFP